MWTDPVVVENFYKKYDPKKKEYACENVNFFAGSNSITGLLGQNGAGKSTLLKAIAGFHYATEGTISVCGCTDLPDIRKNVAFVPEIPVLDRSLTVKELLFLEASLFGNEESQSCRGIVDRAVEICALNEVFLERVSKLSRGFLQRVSLAKSICRKTKVIVMDEFSSGLDPVQNALIRRQIVELAKTKTIILSTHHIEEAQNLCNKVYIMIKGMVACNGTIDEVVSFSGCRNLEEAFIRLTGN